MRERILRGGNLIDEKGDIFMETDILLEDGKLARIGKGLSREGAEELDCRGRYVTPGFAVLHAHSPMHILRGLAEEAERAGARILARGKGKSEVKF